MVPAAQVSSTLHRNRRGRACWMASEAKTPRPLRSAPTLIALISTECTGGLPQIAYARVVTDHATFAWLCDVYVDPSHRGGGLGSWLIDTIVSTLASPHLKRVLLSTHDAHDWHERV